MKEISIGFYVSAEGWVLWLFLVSSATERSDFFFLQWQGCLLKICLLRGVSY